MPDKPLRYGKLRKILARYGLRIDEMGGKGSEALIVRDEPRKIHCIGKHGKNPEIPKAVVAAIRRKFGLTPKHGVSDREFYGRG